MTISEESLKIFGDQNLKLERRNQDLQNSKMCKTCCRWSCSNVSEVRNEVQSDLERENDRLQVCEIINDKQYTRKRLHSKFYFQELLQVFTDQNEKLERRNQDNQEARTCKICMDEELAQGKPHNHTQSTQSSTIAQSHNQIAFFHTIAQSECKFLHNRTINIQTLQLSITIAQSTW